MDLGAWVTLANGNGVGFPEAHTQVVAGRVNREAGTLEPIDVGGPIVATCWPRGTTSDPPEILQLKKITPFGISRELIGGRMAAPAADMALQEVAVTAAQVVQEQLGDLKLYRIPAATTVASRQSKQVRLLDRSAIPVERVYGAELSSSNLAGPQPATWLLRTKNNEANHLGVPLPSGRVAVFLEHGEQPLLANESDVRDLAIDEEVEIGMGERARCSGNRDRGWRLIPRRIANARPEAIQFELTLNFHDAPVRVRQADRRMGTKNGHPIFRLSVPANSTLTLHYETLKSDAAATGRPRKN